MSLCIATGGIGESNGLAWLNTGCRVGIGEARQGTSDGHESEEKGVSSRVGVCGASQASIVVPDGTVLARRVKSLRRGLG